LTMTTTTSEPITNAPVVSTVNVKSKNSTRGKHNYLNVSTFLSKIQKKVAPDHNFKRVTIDALSGFLDFVCEKVVETMLSLKRQTHKQTIDAASVQAAVKLVFPGDLGKFAISSGTSSVVNYQNFKPTLNKPNEKDSQTNDKLDL